MRCLLSSAIWAREKIILSPRMPTTFEFAQESAD
jgi:hypothetical protein